MSPDGEEEERAAEKDAAGGWVVGWATGGRVAARRVDCGREKGEKSWNGATWWSQTKASGNFSQRRSVELSSFVIFFLSDFSN